MRITNSLFAAVLAIALASGAQAKTTTLGTLSDGDFGSSSHHVSPNTSLFTDTVTFSLAGTSTLSDYFFGVGLSSWNVALDRGSSFIGSFAGTGPVNFGTLTFNALSKGDYTFTITGSTPRHHGGAYFNAFNVTAVPEADTWVMLIIGAVLVAFRLRRRQQMLPPRSITAG
jgi:hypothetical protein